MIFYENYALPVFYQTNLHSTKFPPVKIELVFSAFVLTYYFCIPTYHAYLPPPLSNTHGSINGTNSYIAPSDIVSTHGAGTDLIRCFFVLLSRGGYPKIMDIFILSGGIEVLYSESPPSHSSLLRFLPLLIHNFFSFLISSEHITILCISTCKSTCLNWSKNQLIIFLFMW